MRFMYHSGKSTAVFSCFSPGHWEGSEKIKLFLSSGELIVQCYFLTQNRIVETKEGNIKLFTSRGLAPTLRIMNSTYYGVFHFNLSLNVNQTTWQISIPRDIITHSKVIAPVEEWFISISLQDGLTSYTTEGTLLDLLREPILQWQLGASITVDQFREIIPYVLNIKIGKCPCANDVVIIGVVCDFHVEGVYLGLSQSGFWETSITRWYNLTEYLCSLFEDCLDFSFVDVVLTNHHLILLTSLGLFVSADLRYPQAHLTEDYVQAKLWYHERCLANRERFEDDFISITFDKNKTLSQTSTCFYSKDPFIIWRPCLPKVKKSGKKVTQAVVAFLIDAEQKTAVYLLKAQQTISVAVRPLLNYLPNPRLKFPVFRFPKSFYLARGMVFHPRSHFLYVYGNQIWLSTDGGNSFVVVGCMPNDPVLRTYHSFYSSDIIFLTQNSSVYLSKAGLRTYTKYGQSKLKICEFYYDHLGSGVLITLNAASFDGVEDLPAFSPSVLTSIDEDVAFSTALAPQYLSEHEIIFFAYVPLNSTNKEMLTFNYVHIGKRLTLRSTGKADIIKVMHHDEVVGFPSSAIAYVLSPFKVETSLESPCLENPITIQKDEDSFYKVILLLNDPGSFAVFRRSDVQKTVVIPGYCSFLLVKLIDYVTALALSTMPARVPLNKTFREKEWLLYDFSMALASMWSISTTSCNYWIQHDESLESPNIIKYLDLGNNYTFKVRAIPRVSKVTQLFQLPHVEVFIGTPDLLQIDSLGYWDDTDSYIIEIYAYNRNIKQGSTSISFVIWQASTFCHTSTIILTLKSSCSYIKHMNIVPNYEIPKSAWENGIYRNKYGFNMIKTLPENYRPPSNMGISVPLTENFYNADPSKPKPRNLYTLSKITGKYKQCLNKSSRAECNCTVKEKLSYSIDVSDCREKVPRYQFPVAQYPITLIIRNEELKDIPMEAPYFVTISEVNHRGTWKVRQYVPETMKKLKKYVEGLIFRPVYNPKFLNLSITGSELFHFRVTVIPGVTFCDLNDEFQIYVDVVPIAFPGRLLIATATAVVVGGFVFFAFLLEMYNVTVWKPFKKMIVRKRKKVF